MGDTRGRVVAVNVGMTLPAAAVVGERWTVGGAGDAVERLHRPDHGWRGWAHRQLERQSRR